jgi:hypothetical protein
LGLWSDQSDRMLTNALNSLSERLWQSVLNKKRAEGKDHEEDHFTRVIGFRRRNHGDLVAPDNADVHVRPFFVVGIRSRRQR